MIDETRIQALNGKSPVKGAYTLYWMQASQRAECNHALEYAISQANERKQPLIVYLGITDRFPEAGERHYYFMLEGLKTVQQSLKQRGIGMLVEYVSPELGAVKYAGNASLVVCDRGYLKIQKGWRNYVAQHIECPLMQVESDVVVPVEAVSDKEEYSAATLRRKMHKVLHRYLVPLDEDAARIDSTRMEFGGCDLSNVAEAVAGIHTDRSVKPVSHFHGGMNEAGKKLKEFIDHKLYRYDELRNDPNEDGVSGLSPYLHFGQISPLYIALEISRTSGKAEDAFLEELIVRRELSMNFVRYNPHYDDYQCLPGWAKRTLSEQQDTRREYVYSREELEKAQTHDAYWNAAEQEMVVTGKMHGYMRMYWGKKILEWTAKPEDAYATALYLNNKYELDGRDPNGFAGVAWCFGKHDRPWGGRTVFGNVRYISAGGLKRKFDADRYAGKYAAGNS